MAFNLFGSKSYLGVDIGTTSIKLAEIGGSKNNLELVNYGLLENYGNPENSNSAIQTSSWKMSEKEIGDLLGKLAEKSGVGVKNAIAAIPAFFSFTSLIEMPLMSEKETAQAMQFQARQYVPLPISSVTVDWLRVGEGTD